MQTIKEKQLLLGMAVGSYFLAFLYHQAFFTYRGDAVQSGLLKLAFTLCFFAAGEALFYYLSKRKGGKVPNHEATFWLVCCVVLALAIVWHTVVEESYYCAQLMAWNNSDGLIVVYGNFLLHAVAAYWVLCRFGWLYRGKTSAWLALDLCNALLIMPFSKFFLRVQVVFSALRSAICAKRVANVEKKTLWVSLLAVGLFVLCFSSALSLLRASDAAFAALLSGWELQFTVPYALRSFWSRFLWSLPIGAYLFGLFAHCIQTKTAPTWYEAELAHTGQKAAQLRLVSQKLLALLLGCFLALYALYFWVQIDYFLGAFWGQLPDAFTISEYARRGFFELCKIMALNFVLLGGVAKLSAVPLRRTRLLKGMAFALLASSLLFAATALSKLVMYISIYGITDLRLLSSWWILVLVLAVFLAMESIRKAQPVVHKLVYVSVASYGLLCFLGG